MIRDSLVLVTLALLWLQPGQLAQTSESRPAMELRSRLEESRQQAIRLLRTAGNAWQEGHRKEASRLLASAVRRISQLSRSGKAFIPPTQRGLLTRLAADLRALSAGRGDKAGSLSLDSYLAVLNDLSRYLREPPSEVTLRTTYAEPRIVEQGGRGHASVMSPAPPQRSSLEDIRELADRTDVVLDFQEMPVITDKNFCGGAEKSHILESGGGGVALFDYDNDGLPDIYIVNAAELTADRKLLPHSSKLYHNLGNWKFEEVPRRAGVDAAAWGYGVCAGDYNNDGYLDIYVTNFGPNLLFRNHGDGTFTEVGAEAGVNHSGWSTGCSFFDADGDGNLDLYVARYAVISWDEVLNPTPGRTWRGGPHVMSGPVGLPGAPDVFYHNEGNGKFKDATQSLGLRQRDESYGLTVLTTDFDNDGWIDLYVANDSNPNFLFHNLGNGRFEEVGLASSAGVNAEGRAQAGMGVDAGDYDGDGLIDFVITTFAHDTKTLYRNLGGGFFEDASLRSGLSARTFERMGWGVAFFDADLDGALDLFFANGHLFPQVDQYPQLRETYRQKSQLLLNQGGQFRDVSEIAGRGLQAQKSGRGLAIGDLDNDGDLDLVITNMDDVPTVLQNRTRTSGHWFGVSLSKDGKNRFCIGARVGINAGGKTQMREIRSGGSYLSQNDLRAYFGLGPYAGKVDVEVRMPGGSRWEWKGLPPDRLVALKLGDAFGSTR